MSRRLPAMLAAEGLSLPPGCPIRYRGGRAFAHGWRSALPGSIAQLTAFLLLVDPDVRLEVRDQPVTASSASVPNGIAAFGTSPSRIRRLVTVTWSANVKVHESSRLASWCRAIADRWHPLGADEVVLQHQFQRGIAVEHDASSLAPVPIRPIAITPAGARTVVAITGDPVRIESRQLVVGHLSNGIFLTNTHPAMPAWRHEGDFWISLRPCINVAIALDSDRPVTITIDGRPANITAEGRGWCHARLPRSVPAGKRIQVTARSIDGPTVACLPNPVMMIAIDRRANTIPSRTCETLLEGGQGLFEATQLLPAIPTSDLRHEFTMSRNDLRSILETELPGVRVASIASGYAGIEKSFRRAMRIGLAIPTDAGVPFDSWRMAALQRVRQTVPVSFDWIIHPVEPFHAD